MKVRTGVIAAAGSGTRMFPVALGYPKELLPILNKPAIHLIVEEFVASGLDRIIIVTGSNPDPLLRQYNRSLFPPTGSYPEVDQFAESIRDVKIIFEPQEGPYGNGTPLLVASRHLRDGEGFVYAFGDDIIHSSRPFTRDLIAAHRRTGALVLGTQPVPWEDVVRYGIARLKGNGAEGEIEDLIEKPSIEEAKSNLAIFGRFLLTQEIVGILRETPLGKSNELWMTDALRAHIGRGGRLFAQSISDGRWLTIGDPVNYLRTVLEYILDDRDLRTTLRSQIEKLAGGD